MCLLKSVHRRCRISVPPYSGGYKIDRSQDDCIFIVDSQRVFARGYLNDSRKIIKRVIDGHRFRRGALVLSRLDLKTLQHVKYICVYIYICDTDNNLSVFLDGSNGKVAYLKKVITRTKYYTKHNRTKQRRAYCCKLPKTLL